MSWIKLVLHPDDPKVAIVALEVGASTSEAYAAMLRWLFWLDENYGEQGVSVSSAMFQVTTKWPNGKLLAAFQNPDVDWIEADGDRYKPTRPETHLDASAKIRAQESKRKLRDRCRRKTGHDADARPEKVGHNADASVTRGEEKRIEERDKTTAPGQSDAVAVDRIPIIDALSSAGFAPQRAIKLAGHPGATFERVQHFIEQAAKPGVDDPLAFIAESIRQEWPVERFNGPRLVADDGASERGFADAMARIEAANAKKAKVAQ